MGGEKHNPFTARVDRYIQDILREWHTPGLTIAITDHGNVSAKGYGYSDLASRRPAEPESLYFIGSITKHIFCSAFAQFLDSEGNKSADNIDFSTPLVEIIRDDFVLQDPAITAQTTIEDALSHRSGLPRFDLAYGGPLDTVQKVTRHVRNLELSEPPRTTFQYCNTMYIVATHAFETASRQTFPSYVHENFFSKLGMRHTYAFLQEAQRGGEGKYKLVTPYHWSEDKFVNVKYMDMPEIGGAGLIISNVLDFARWMQMLLTKGAPLSEAAHAQLRTPRTIMLEDPNGWDTCSMYCLGLMRTTYRGLEIFTHTGGLYGFTTNMILIPALNWGTILMSNIDAPEGFMITVVGCYLVDELLGVPESERVDHNARLRREKNKEAEKLKGARARIYPHLPSPAVPCALAVGSYVGTYRSAAFRDITFYVPSSDEVDSEDHAMGTEREAACTDYGNGVHAAPLRLVSRNENRTWNRPIELEHVSGEFWLGRWQGLLAFKAEFKLGSDGKVAQLGLALEEKFGDRLFWFDRLSD